MRIDKLSQRILAGTLGVSALLMSLSLFITVIDRTGKLHAEEHAPVAMPNDWDTELRGGVGLGIVDGTGYFVVWARPNKLYKVDLQKATDWYSE